MNQDQTPYIDAILTHAAREPGRFYIPGHKGGTGADPAAIRMIGKTAFRNDIPALMPGIDVGESPTPFEVAQALAADAWGADRTWFLLNGASQANHVTCMALAHVGSEIVVQRNVHSSVIDGSILAGLKPTFVAPEIDPDLGIPHCLTPESLSAALDQTPNAVAVIIVSPTYFGACADVAALAEVAHTRGIPLVTDEAWGAHMHFHPDLPPDALSSGADVVVSSTHKTVGSLSQAAMIHVAGDLIDARVIDRCVSMTESTSPSALLTGSLDGARHRAAVHGEELLSETIDTLASTREVICGIPGLDVLDERMVGRAGVAGWDPLRLSIDVRGTGWSGYEIARHALTNHDINFELFAENVVVAVFGMGSPAAPEADRLIKGMRATIENLGPSSNRERIPFAPPPPWGELAMPLRDAYLGPQDVVPFGEAEGRVSAESLAAYPPGIPNVLPGERLTRETLEYIAESVTHGGSVRGASDRGLKTLRVLRES